MQRKWFGREPALVIQGVAAVLAVLVAWGFPGLTDSTAGAIIAVLVALAACLTAAQVRPWAPSIFGGLITTGLALLSSYGLHYPQTRTALLTAAAAAGVALLTRPQQTPTAAPPE